MKHKRRTEFLLSLLALAAFTGSVLAAPVGRVKVYILAGDENMLRQGSIDGIGHGPGPKDQDPAGATKRPGILLNVLKENPRFAFLRDAEGKWTKRNDVALYDAHPLSNNTRDPARLLQVPSDPAKHPDFAGNVASIDTIPFFFPKDKSPGGREWDYFNNAESFLLIGEATGKAMLELMKAGPK